MPARCTAEGLCNGGLRWRCGHFPNYFKHFFKQHGECLHERNLKTLFFKLITILKIKFAPGSAFADHCTCASKTVFTQLTSYRAARRYARQTIAADLRPCADGSAVRTALVAWLGLGAARLAGLGAQRSAQRLVEVGQTDRRTDRGIA